jgi:hypothetical protein
MSAPYRFDVALSYATEDRHYVKRVATALLRRGLRVFYDQHFAAELLGADLTVYLDDVYRKDSRFVVVFQSVHYAQKAWPKRELRSALTAAILERRDLILPARLDDTPLPGLLPTIGSVNCRHTTPERLAALIAEKLRA